MTSVALLSIHQSFRNLLDNEVVGYFLFTALLAALVILVFLVFEKREKFRAKKRFQEISKGSLLVGGQTRTLPRFGIPADLDVILSGEANGRTFKARLVNISPSGFCAQGLSSTEWLIADTVLPGMLVQTPVNRFALGEIKCMWILEQINRKLYGFQILDIEEVDLQRMAEFQAYLKKYLQQKD